MNHCLDTMCTIRISYNTGYQTCQMGHKQKKTIWQTYKEWVKQTFPGKPPKVIERWDFIMVFEVRYRDEIEAFFQKYINVKVPGNDFKVIVNEKEEEILVLIAVSQE
jgi:hypothetical protein